MLPLIKNNALPLTQYRPGMRIFSLALFSSAFKKEYGVSPSALSVLILINHAEIDTRYKKKTRRFLTSSSVENGILPESLAVFPPCAAETLRAFRRRDSLR
jgi:AraC-like DNA-binding protein